MTKSTLLRIPIYLIMAAVWSSQHWSPWAFVLAALVIMFGSRFIAKEFPFGGKNG